MGISVPLEINDVYQFEWGEETYTYKTRNKREYTNQEFLNILKTSSFNWMYYKEPCTMHNDPDGWLVSQPRDEKADRRLLNSIKIILAHTKSEKVKQLVNNILSKCLIIDEEPKLADGCKLDDEDVNCLKAKEYGKYHVDQYEIEDNYRDAINFAAHKYILTYCKDRCSAEDKKNIDLLLKAE